METPNAISRYNVARRLSKRGLLIAINCVAGLSIFFFGYVSSLGDDGTDGRTKA